MAGGVGLHTSSDCLKKHNAETLLCLALYFVILSNLSEKLLAQTTKLKIITTLTERNTKHII